MLVDQAINVLMDLIKIETVAPPGENYLEIVTYLDNLLTNYGLSTRIIEVPKSIVREYYPEYADYSRYILLAELCNTKGEKIHFNAHYDVVPGGSGWLITEPFRPVLINGRVYGRGASDDKGGMTALVLLAKQLSELRDFSGCVEFSFTPDEELGGITGVGYLTNQIIKPDYAIVAEPTGLDMVWIGSMGVLQLDIIVRGIPSHASQPWYGINAFEDGVRIAHSLIEELKPRIESRQFMGKKASITLGGLVRGSNMRNLVPNYFHFSIDRRILPSEDVDTVLNELFNYVNELRRNIKSTIDINIVSRVESALNNDSRLLSKLINAVSKILRINPRVGISSTPVDTRYLQRAGIDALTYGPGNTTSAHGPDEYIEVNDIIKSVDVYLQLVRDVYGDA